MNLPIRKVFGPTGWTLVTAGTLGLTTLGMAQQPVHRPAGTPGRLQPTAAVEAAPVLDHESYTRAVAMKVELAWLANRATFSYGLDAQVEGPVLLVRGFVPNEAVRAIALQVAREASDLQVVDQFQIQPNLAMRSVGRPSAELKAAAADAVEEAFPKHARDIEVNVLRNGQLTVSGTIPSLQDKLAVSKRLYRINGCAGVINNLHIATFGHEGRLHAPVTSDLRYKVPADIIAPNAAGTTTARRTVMAAEPPTPVTSLSPQRPVDLPASRSLPPQTRASTPSQPVYPSMTIHEPPPPPARPQPASVPAADKRSVKVEAPVVKPDRPFMRVPAYPAAFYAGRQPQTTSQRSETRSAPTPAAPAAQPTTVPTPSQIRTVSAVTPAPVASSTPQTSATAGKPALPVIVPAKAPATTSPPLATNSTVTPARLTAPASVTRPATTITPATAAPVAPPVVVKPEPREPVMSQTTTLRPPAPPPSPPRGTAVGSASSTSMAVSARTPALVAAAVSAPRPSTLSATPTMTTRSNSTPIPVGVPYVASGTLLIESAVESPPPAPQTAQPASRTMTSTPTALPARQVAMAKRSTPSPTKPAVFPEVSQLKDRIQNVCMKPGKDVEVVVKGPTDVHVRVKARNVQEGQQLSMKIMQMPELRPYHVDLEVQLAPR